MILGLSKNSSSPLGIDDDNSIDDIFLKVIEVNPEYSAAYKESQLIFIIIWS